MRKNDIPREWQICQYCDHRDYNHEAYLPILRPWGISIESTCPCLVNAIEADAGGSIVMLAEDGHCRYDKDLFLPAEDCKQDLLDAGILAPEPEVDIMTAAKEAWDMEDARQAYDRAFGF